MRTFPCLPALPKKQTSRERETCRHLSDSSAVHRSDRSSLGTQPCPSSGLLTDMHTHTDENKVLTDPPWDISVTMFSYIYESLCLALSLCVSLNFLKAAAWNVFESSVQFKFHCCSFLLNQHVSLFQMNQQNNAAINFCF